MFEISFLPSVPLRQVSKKPIPGTRPSWTKWDLINDFPPHGTTGTIVSPRVPVTTWVILNFPLSHFEVIKAHSGPDPIRVKVPLPVSSVMLKMHALRSGSSRMHALWSGPSRMHALRFGPSRRSLRIFVSELSFQYSHHHAILGTAHPPRRPRPQEHQTGLETVLGLHLVVHLFVVRLFAVLLAALAVVPEAIHAAVEVAVWVAVLPGAHCYDSRGHPIAS